MKGLRLSATATSALLVILLCLTQQQCESRIGQQDNNNDINSNVDNSNNIDAETFISYHRPPPRRRLSDSLDELPDNVPVLVTFKNKDGRTRAHELCNHDHYYDETLARHHTIAAVISKENILALEEDDNIDFIEKDEYLYREGRFTPYGVRTSQGSEYNNIPAASPDLTLSGSCSNPDAIRVAIIDDGLDIGHPDIMCGDVNDEASRRCYGKSYVQRSDAAWDTPVDAHGTHVVGTIGAVDNSGLGLRGMIDDGNICFIIARVFDNDGGVLSSVVLNAVDWVVDEGAKIINLSLGGGGYSWTAERVMVSAYNAGSIVFASAGNSGEPTLNYPASYTNVVSVGAVNETMGVADFSNYNTEVDIVAAGVEILSTVPRGNYRTIAIVLSEDSIVGAGLFMYYSTVPLATVTGGPLVDCGVGDAKCPGDGNHVCIIMRGEVLFSVKAKNCADSGAAAVLIYNDEPGYFEGTAGHENTIQIPIVQISGIEGQELLSSYIGKSITITPSDSYDFASGTSMAAPHVAGAAALIWRECPACRNSDVISCLETTASDLGEPGKDQYYGYGLVQADAAYTCLSSLSCCAATTVRENTAPTTSITSEFPLTGYESILNPPSTPSASTPVATPTVASVPTTIAWPVTRPRASEGPPSFSFPTLFGERP